MSKIAVITPCFNSEKFIQDCVLSVQKCLNFGEFDIEHLVVDDGSTDNSWSILQSLEFDNLTKLRLPENRGPSAARNYAVAKTDADYLYCLDSDDVIFQNSLRTLYRDLIRNHSRWVYGDSIKTDENLKYLIGEDIYGWHHQSPASLLEAMFTGWQIFQHTSLFEHKLFDQVEGYNEELKMAEDFDLFTRFILSGNFPTYAPVPLFLYRIHSAGQSASQKTSSEMHMQDVVITYRKYREQIKKIISADQLRKIEKVLANYLSNSE